MTGRLAVFGGAGGIGRALCAAARGRGYDLVVFDLPASLARHPTTDPAHPLDLRDGAETTRAVDAAANGETFDGAVLLAGFMGASEPVTECAPEAWEDLIAGNLTGTYAAARAVIPHLGEGASIVLIGSGLGHFARPGYGGYAVAKAGIAALGRQLALELAPRIRVNTIAPSAVDTAFLRGGTGRSDEGQTSRFDTAAYGASIPMGRIAVPDDITGPILFLLSEDARYVTGQVLHVNGGAYMP